MSIEVMEQRREELLREAESNRPKKALRAGRGRSAASPWASALGWELARATGSLRKYFRPLKNPG